MNQVRPNKWSRELPYLRLEVADLKAGVERVLEARDRCFIKPPNFVEWTTVTVDGHQTRRAPLEALDEAFEFIDGATIHFHLRLFHREATPRLDLEMAPSSFLQLSVDFDSHRFLVEISTVGNENANELMELLTRDIDLITVKLPDEHRYLESYLRRFLADHPEPSQNVFLIMRFEAEEAIERTARAVRQACARRGISVLRADDKSYTDDLWDNVMTYLYGCESAVAVFDEINYREHNPNVALEVGFMFALRKPVLLLKDCAMRAMPADLIGRIYRPFDTYNPDSTVPPQVEKWLRDNDLGKLRG